MSTFLFRNRSINDFLNVLASPASVPGGGAVAGLQGAEACALAEMVCNFTLTNKKYASIESDVREVLAKLFSARNEFLSLMDKDAEGFSKLMEVLQKPKESFSSHLTRTCLKYLPKYSYLKYDFSKHFQRPRHKPYPSHNLH